MFSLQSSKQPVRILQRITISLDQIREKADNPVRFFKDDLEDGLFLEILQFKEIVNKYAQYGPVTKEDGKGEISYEAKLYKLLCEKNLKDIFPNMEIALRIYLILMPPTNCTSERSFSKLKNIKNHKTSCMTRDHLNSRASMSLDSNILENLDSDEIIDEFADLKSRKVQL